MNKCGGRPKKEIDKAIFEELCAIQCTLNEIAGVFRCHIDTIDRFCREEYDDCFSNVFKKYSEEGKSSLRRAQWKKAVYDGNTTMLIWLGKQYLGQTEKIQNIDESTSKALNDIVGAIKGVRDEQES